jgi:hypothetical protein
MPKTKMIPPSRIINGVIPHVFRVLDSERSGEVIVSAKNGVAALELYASAHLETTVAATHREIGGKVAEGEATSVSTGLFGGGAEGSKTKHHLEAHRVLGLRRG